MFWQTNDEKIKLRILYLWKKQQQYENFLKRAKEQILACKGEREILEQRLVDDKIKAVEQNKKV